MIIAPQLTQRSYFWTNWKAACAVKGGQHQYDDDGMIYTIWFYDGPEVHLCSIWKGSVPDSIITSGYTQAQNDSDKTDFITSFLSSANTAIVPRASDGRAQFCNTYAKKMHHYSLRVFSLAPGNPASLVNKNVDFTNMSDVTVMCYDGYGNATSNPYSTIKTIIDMEPTYNYEVIGGWVNVSSSLLGSTPGAWYMAMVGVPDVPASMGGSVPFIYPVDLALLSEPQIVSDGRATQYLTYSATLHTNKLRWVIMHPASVSNPQLQIFVETFV